MQSIASVKWFLFLLDTVWHILTAIIIYFLQGLFEEMASSKHFPRHVCNESSWSLSSCKETTFAWSILHLTEKLKPHSSTFVKECQWEILKYMCPRRSTVLKSIFQPSVFYFASTHNFLKTYTVSVFLTFYFVKISLCFISQLRM